MKRRLEILQVTPFYPPHIGGAEKYVYNLTRKLRLAGNGVTVMTSGSSPELVGSRNQILLPIMYTLGGDWGEIPICPTILLELGRVRPDVIHVHTPPRFFAELTVFHRFFCRRTALSEMPLIVTYHLHNEGLLGLKNAIMRLHNRCIMKSVLGRASQVVVLTDKYKEIVCDVFGVEPGKVSVIPNAVDDEFFNSENYPVDDCRKKFGISGENVILYLGRLASYKGLDYLLESVSMLKKKLPDIQLLIAGEGGYEKNVRDISKRLGIDSEVRFLGKIDDADVPRVLSVAKLLVLPSLTEAFPTVLLEAFSMGKPVVTTDVGAIPGVVLNGQTGLIVQRRNSRQLAESILSLLSDERLSARMGELGQKIVRARYSWDSVARQILDVYNNLL
jgi:glycosyltransferase involved in cell wall biosynthesis